MVRPVRLSITTPLIRFKVSTSNILRFFLTHRSSTREQTGPRRIEDLWLADAPQPCNGDESLGLVTGKVPPGRGVTITRMRRFTEPTLSALGDELVLCGKYWYHVVSHHCILGIAHHWRTTRSPVLISIGLCFPCRPRARVRGSWS